MGLIVAWRRLPKDETCGREVFTYRLAFIPIPVRVGARSAWKALCVICKPFTARLCCILNIDLTAFEASWVRALARCKAIMSECGE